MEVPVSTGGEVVVAESFHKMAALSQGYLWFLGQPESGQLGFLGCELEWNVPEQKIKGLCLTSFP